MLLASSRLMSWKEMTITNSGHSRWILGTRPVMMSAQRVRNEPPFLSTAAQAASRSGSTAGTEPSTCEAEEGGVGRGEGLEVSLV